MLGWKKQYLYVGKCWKCISTTLSTAVFNKKQQLPIFLFKILVEIYKPIIEKRTYHPSLFIGLIVQSIQIIIPFLKKSWTHWRFNEQQLKLFGAIRIVSSRHGGHFVYLFSDLRTSYCTHIIWRRFVNQLKFIPIPHILGSAAGVWDFKFITVSCTDWLSSSPLSSFIFIVCRLDFCLKLVNHPSLNLNISISSPRTNKLTTSWSFAAFFLIIGSFIRRRRFVQSHTHANNTTSGLQIVPSRFLMHRTDPWAGSWKCWALLSTRSIVHSPEGIVIWNFTWHHRNSARPFLAWTLL